MNVNGATAAQFELPAMPQPSKLAKAIRTAKEELEAFQRDANEQGGLVMKQMAARLCNVSNQRICQLCEEGRFTIFHHVDKEFLSANEVKAFMLQERKSGRPWKAPSGVGLIKDMLKK